MQTLQIKEIIMSESSAFCTRCSLALCNALVACTGTCQISQGAIQIRPVKHSSTVSASGLC